MIFRRIFRSFLFALRHRRANLRCRWPVWFEEGAEVEGYNHIGRFSHVFGRVGCYTYMDVRCCIEGDIGRFCSIAWDVVTIVGRHPLEKFVSTHPIFFSNAGQCGISFVEESVFPDVSYADPQRRKHVIIENDVWIGAYVKIIGGVTIHNGAVVLAGAVVTKDVPPYAIVGGIPAKVIRYRFDEETIAQLLRFRWWDRDEEFLRQHLPEMQDIEKMKQLMRREEDSCQEK